MDEGQAEWILVWKWVGIQGRQCHLGIQNGFATFEAAQKYASESMGPLHRGVAILPKATLVEMLTKAVK